MIIGILNGPNLNLLGTREPAIYGTATLDDILAHLGTVASSLGVELRSAQANGEGQLIDTLHEWRSAVQGVVVNAGAYTHTSLALYDAIRAISVPVIEVHLSNPAAREAYRHHSYVGMAAKGTIAGFGPLGYMLALEAALDQD